MNFKEFLHTVPFIRLLFPFVLGITLAEFFFIENKIVSILILVSLCILLLFQSLSIFRKSYAYNFIYGIFIFLFCIGSGVLRTNYSNASMYLSSTDSITAFKGVIKDIPSEKTKSIACVLTLQKVYVNKCWKKTNANVLLYLAKDSLSKLLNIEDEILISSDLSRVGNNGNPNEFDYAQYLKYRYILYSTYVDSSSWKQLEKKQKYSIKRFAVTWRQNLLDVYKKAGLENEAYEILAALTLGARDEVSDDVKTVWAAAGATHVLAVSGLHVGIIFAVMQFLLRFLSVSKFGRFIRGTLLILCLWLYALLTGLSPSVMRAASMFSILAIGLMINRKGTVYNSLAISALLLLWINPFVLFAVGFQFSYLAVVSIVFFQPRFEKLLTVHSVVMRWLWQLFTVSLAAQVATFPLAVYYFHQFPSYFFLSNFVVIPAAGLLIYASVLLLIFSGIDFISHILGSLLNYFVGLIHEMIYQIQSLPGALIERINFTSFQVILLYSLVISTTLLFWWKRKQALFVSILILIIFQMIPVLNLYESRSSEMIVFNAYKHTVVGIRDNRSILVLSDTILSDKQKNRLIYPYGMAKGVKQYQYEVLKENECRIIGDKKIAIVSNSNLRTKIERLQADYFILRNNAFNKPSDLSELENGIIIRDASNYRMKSEILNVNIWNTKQDGAYRVVLGGN